jgi:hypothetical protein
MRSLGEEMDKRNGSAQATKIKKRKNPPHLARQTTGEEEGIFRRRPAPGNLNPRLLLLLGPAGADANSSRN